MRARRAILLLAVVAASIVAWNAWSPTLQIAPAMQRASPWGGHAYVFTIDPTHVLLRSGSDTTNEPAASTLVLIEDGRELGPAHSIHRDIASQGRGAYSHWGNAVVFSASDNSDPRSNGRRYEIRLRVAPARWVLGASIALLLAIAATALMRSEPARATAVVGLAGRGAIAVVFAAAAAASLTHWIPVRGEVSLSAASLRGLAASPDPRPGIARSVPFERLVGPFLIVPSGDERPGQGHLSVRLGDRDLRETFELASWADAADAVFLDGDRIGGDGILVYLTHAVSDRGGTLVIAYAAVATPAAIAFLWGAFCAGAFTWWVARRLRGHPPFARVLLVLATALGIAGATLAGLNLVGLILAPRSDAPQLRLISAEAASAPARSWAGFAALDRELAPRSTERREDYVVRMNDLVAGHVRHVWNYANATELGIHVPPWSNFVLWWLGETRPRLYRYHYAAWRPAIARGAGMCAQSTLILVGILRERGFDARIVQLEGHTVTTVEASPGTWYVLDPDIGVAIRQDLKAIERDPQAIRRPYEEAYARLGHPNPESAAEAMATFYASDRNYVEPRGGNEMLGESWVRRERLAEWLKWLVPIALLAAAALLGALGVRADRHAFRAASGATPARAPLRGRAPT